MSGRDLSWLEVVLLTGVSALDKEKVLQKTAGPGEALEILHSLPGTSVDTERLRDLHRRMGDTGTRLVGYTDPLFPPELKTIVGAPAALFYRGRPEVLRRPCVAVVGTRAATRRGRVVARQLAASLSSLGLVVVSGLARGVDAAAHEGSLEGDGGAVAVLGTGVDRVYPPENRSLARRIEGRGCLVSELPPGSPPLRHTFPRRNRIISGMSLGVIVVEGGVRSGALNTARWAAEQGRDVMAVPGPVEHPLSRGPHALIKQGAQLVETARDVLEALGPRAGRLRAEDGAEGEGEVSGEGSVLDCLEWVPLHLEEIGRRTRLARGELVSILVRLEMEGKVRASGGGTYSRRAPELGLSGEGGR
jgi:DNA processing protein